MSVEMISPVRAPIGQPDMPGPSGQAQELLAAPNASLALGADDVLVALAIVMVKQKKEERVAADRSMEASAKAQQAAQGRKIEKMHELADDTLMGGIVSGALEGASAIATGAGAVTKFSGEMTELKAGDSRELFQESKRLVRDAGLLDAVSKGFGATERFGGGLYKSAQERDRTQSAEADAAKDSAKASLDAAASAVNRANEDIRATIAALRQLIAAKTQLANAAIIRG